MKDKENKKIAHLFGISMVLAFILPHTYLPLLLVNPIMCISLVMMSKNKKRYHYNYLIIVAILIPLFLNAFQGVSLKSLQIAGVIVLYAYTFPFIDGVKIHKFYFFLTFAFILLTQLIYLIGIPFLTNLLDTVYPISEFKEGALMEMQDNINTQNMLDYRMGGLYRNSNNCSEALSILFASYLVLNHKEGGLNPIDWIFTLLCYIAIILTGSRTGFVVGTLVLIAYIYLGRKVSRAVRNLFILVFIAAFIVIIQNGSDVFRGLNVLQGFNDSANVKMDTFTYYLQNEDSFINLLFGNFDASKFKGGPNVLRSFDSDYGTLIYSYGFIGFILILIYYFSIFRRVDKVSKIYFFTLLWMYSSTIVKSYRVIFIYMLLLSIIYTNNRKINIRYK